MRPVRFTSGFGFEEVRADYPLSLLNELLDGQSHESPLEVVCSTVPILPPIQIETVLSCLRRGPKDIAAIECPRCPPNLWIVVWDQEPRSDGKERQNVFPSVTLNKRQNWSV